MERKDRELQFSTLKYARDPRTEVAARLLDVTPQMTPELHALTKNAVRRCQLHSITANERKKNKITTTIKSAAVSKVPFFCVMRIRLP